MKISNASNNRTTFIFSSVSIEELFMKSQEFGKESKLPFNKNCHQKVFAISIVIKRVSQFAIRVAKAKIDCYASKE